MENLKKEFTEMVKQYKAVIYKICYIYTQNSDELNDSYQEVLINLWKSYAHFRGESKISSWIYRISLNTCISLIRKKRSSPSIVPITLDMDLFEESVEKKHQIEEMYRCINKLNKFEKAIILLWLEDRNYEEIASITGLTRSNVAVKLLRIKNKLKEISNQ